MPTIECRLELDADFEDRAWEVEAKGWYPSAVAFIGGRRCRIVFYDAARLAQDIAADLGADRVFFEPNLVVVPAVTRKHMENAVRHLASSARRGDLLEERPA